MGMLHLLGVPSKSPSRTGGELGMSPTADMAGFGRRWACVVHLGFEDFQGQVQLPVLGLIALDHDPVHLRMAESFGPPNPEPGVAGDIVDPPIWSLMVMVRIRAQSFRPCLPASPGSALPPGSTGRSRDRCEWPRRSLFRL